MSKDNWIRYYKTTPYWPIEDKTIENFDRFDPHTKDLLSQIKYYLHPNGLSPFRITEIEVEVGQIIENFLKKLLYNQKLNDIIGE